MTNVVTVEVPQLRGRSGLGAEGALPREGGQAVQGPLAGMGKMRAAPLVLSWAGSWAPRFIAEPDNPLEPRLGNSLRHQRWWNGLGAEPALVGKQGSVRKLVPIANDFGFYWAGTSKAVRRDARGGRAGKGLMENVRFQDYEETPHTLKEGGGLHCPRRWFVDLSHHPVDFHRHLGDHQPGGRSLGPLPFILLNLMLSFQAARLRHHDEPEQARCDDHRAHLDYKTNQLAEEEARAIIAMLERQEKEIAELKRLLQHKVNGSPK